MPSRPLLLVIALSLLSAVPSPASTIPVSYEWTNFAGSTSGGGFSDGPGSDARFSTPDGIARDAAGFLYVADSRNHTIRKISPAGVVTTLAGKAGVFGSDDGPAADARFNTPTGVAVAPNGDVYVADSQNSTIRLISAAGQVTTIAGNPLETGSADGPGVDARFWRPNHLAIDSDGNVYVTDQANSTVRKISLSGEVSTFAGLAGETGTTNGIGAAARFWGPSGIAVDANGNVYVADENNELIRKITPAGVVTTLAGKAGVGGQVDGLGSAARFSTVGGLAVDAAGNIYAGEFDAIRKITPAGKATRLPIKVPLEGLGFGGYWGVVIDPAGTIFATGNNQEVVWKITPSNQISLFAGSPLRSGAVDSTGDAARFTSPDAIASDAAGNVYVGDNFTIRKISPSRAVQTLAGKAGARGSIDGTGNAARFGAITAMAATADGTLYVCDSGRGTVRKVTPAGVVTTLAGAAGQFGSKNGRGTAARLGSFISDMAIDSSGNLFLADFQNFTIRRVTPSGEVSTVAGRPGGYGFADGSGSKARFGFVYGLTITSTGTIYVADPPYLRRMTAAGEVTTIRNSQGEYLEFYGNRMTANAAGTVFAIYQGAIQQFTEESGLKFIGGGSPGNLPGVGSEARFDFPYGIACGPAGEIYLSDSRNHNIVVGRPYEHPELSVGGTPLAAGSGTVQFGSADLGGAGSVRTFTLTNRGNAPLSELAITLEDADDFQVTTALGTATLAPGASATFSVTFTAGPLGVSTGQLKLEYEVPDGALASPLVVNLRGIARDPALPLVSLTSSNANPAWARVGDTITLDFTSSEPIQPPAVELLGASVTANNVSGNRWTATVPVTALTPEGNVDFIIDAEVIGGGAVIVDATTDASEVTVDRTAPLADIPSNIALDAGPTGRVSLAELPSFLTASDALGPITILQNPSASTIVRRGTHPVSLTVRDAAGNQTIVNTEVETYFFQSSSSEIWFLQANSKRGPVLPTDTGLPDDSFLAALSPPAINDDRTMVTRATVATPKSRLGAILVLDGGGSPVFPVFQGSPAPDATGNAPLPNVTFKSFLDPVASPDEAIAFVGTLQGTGATGAAIGLWSDLDQPGKLRLLLREGTVVSGLTDGARLRSITSVALRNEGLLALIRLRNTAGITPSNDTALILIPRNAAPVPLLRTGSLLGGQTGAMIKSFSVLQPAQFSPGQGRWFQDGTTVARVTLASGEVRIVALDTAGAVTLLLSTTDTPGTIVPSIDSAARWRSFGLPSLGAPTGALALTATLQAGLGGITTANDAVILTSVDGSSWDIFAAKGDVLQTPGGDFVITGLSDPVSNALGDTAWLAALARQANPASKSTALCLNDVVVAQLGALATDESGTETTARWSRILSFALTPEHGVIFLAETTGGDTTPANKVGLWSSLNGLTQRRLRTGDQTTFWGSNNRTPRSFALLNALPGSFGATRSFSELGSVGMLVTFTDNTQELLRIDLD